MKKLIVLSICVASALHFSSVFATGRMTCDSGDPAKWKSQDELQASVIEQGWKVRRIKIDGGCYELYGTNPDGKRVEAYFDPLTLEKLLVAQRGEILFKKDPL